MIHIILLQTFATSKKGTDMHKAFKTFKQIFHEPPAKNQDLPLGLKNDPAPSPTSSVILLSSWLGLLIQTDSSMVTSVMKTSDPN